MPLMSAIRQFFNGDDCEPCAVVQTVIVDPATCEPIDFGPTSPGDIIFPPSVVVRETCVNGVSTLAYDVIPSGATSAEDITTIYRTYPTSESNCDC